MRTREDHIGIRQMATLLRAGYPLSDALRLAITELVSEAARAARKTPPGAQPRQGKKKK